MNAFAAPGGRIVIFTGLLEKVERPEELAGVLAHEMQHILGRHSTKAIFHELSTSILFSAILGDAGGVARSVLDGARTLGGLSYGRRHESEADALGMELVQKARIDAAGMVRFFEILQKEFGREPRLLKYLSSHPSTLERIRALKELAGKAAYIPVPLAAPEEWRDAMAQALAR